MTSIKNKKIKRYEVKITREELITYIYHLNASTKKEAEKMAASGNYEHDHAETVPRTVEHQEIESELME